MQIKSTLLSLLLLSSPAMAAERIVVLSSDVAEIAVALGHAKDVVGRDRGAKMTALAHAAEIGSSRNLSAEPIARLQPSLVIGSPLAQPETLWPQLQGLGLKTTRLGTREDGADYSKVIQAMGRLLGSEARAQQLASSWEAGMRPQGSLSGKRILISYEGKTVAGRNTPADTLIRAAGAVNAVAHVDGYKPLDGEALAQLQPDMILVAEHNRAVYGGLKGLLARSDVAMTPAARNGKVFEVPVHSYFTVNLDSPKAVQKIRELLNAS